MRGRYYDTFTQQFISRDPQEALSGQPYVYAGGNPVNFSDPTGALPSFSSMFQTADDGVPGDGDEPVIGGGGGGGGGSGWSAGGGRLGQGSIQGALAANAKIGVGLGKLADRTIRVTQKGLDMIRTHLSRAELDDAINDPANQGMVGRLETALTQGGKISGADASYYLHELSEFTLMNRGIGWRTAHEASFVKYRVSPFSIYHPDVLMALPPGSFSPGYYEFWGITR